VGAVSEVAQAGVKPVAVRTFFRIGMLLTLIALLLGAVRFARYDWSGLPLARSPVTAVKDVSSRCVEHIKPYTTESGRVISPVVIDEQQYLNLVEYYRGVPESKLQLTCLYDPFTNRSGMSWIAHFLPFEEGLALGVTNTVMLLLGLWLVLAALRVQGATGATILAVGLLYTVSWNVLMFGTAVLVDTGVVAAVALCWYLLASRRPWFVVPIMLLGYPLKETVGIIVPVMAVWAWNEYRSGRRSLGAAAAPTVAAALAFVVGVAFWRGALPTPDAAWPVTPDVSNLVHNLTDVISLGSFVVGVGPLLIPAFLAYLRAARRDGWVRSCIDPAVVGVVLTLGVCFWSFITVDLTPRLFWIGFPFAATLAARWFSEGRPAEWLDRLPLVRRIAA
jgi:hypothetical protein